ncbi:dipeptidase [Burkholderia sp. L27(2015)]|uniref:dipeptidase n=1 Tax=Burkholderia sp. L27(2015) TaxID=1641858 RepID=UPI00131B7A2A|nr:membrane dipeptidase [Burkholderia sp. L27(2015)]
MPIEWSSIYTGQADALHGSLVEISGWAVALSHEANIDYFLLAPEAPCCHGCLPGDPMACVEVFTASPIPFQTHAITIRGQLRRLIDDPAGWRYQLIDARLIPVQPDNAAPSPGRRAFLASGAALGLAACAPGRFAAYTDSRADSGTDSRADSLVASTANSSSSSSAPIDRTNAWRDAKTMTIDMHSHAGRVIVSRDPAVGANRPFLPLAAPMRTGGMNVVCLAIVTDTLVTRVSSDRRRFEAYRTPQAGELYALGQAEFARVHTLIEREQLTVVTDSASLSAHGNRGPCAIISAEGADFLEGELERVDEAYSLHQLRHLQLTHYRVNELGDIQTAAPVHGGLTDFGADVVRRCNTLGIVVDVAHGTYDLVKRAATVTTKPLVLSHTALATRPSSRSRLITPDHARAIAGTGGVIGVWPNSGNFHDLRAMAEGVKRMTDVVGVDHVGLGTDMLGFISPPVFTGYEQLPAFAQALLDEGYTADEVNKILGGNYRRVFDATVG